MYADEQFAAGLIGNLRAPVERNERVCGPCEHDLHITQVRTVGLDELAEAPCDTQRDILLPDSRNTDCSGISSAVTGIDDYHVQLPPLSL